MWRKAPRPLQIRASPICHCARLALPVPAAKVGGASAIANSGEPDLPLRSACTTGACGEGWRRLGHCKFGRARFAIALGLHYRCLRRRLAAPRPLQIRASPICHCARLALPVPAAKVGGASAIANSGEPDLPLRSACTTGACGEGWRRLGHCKFGRARFAIALGLHYLCVLKLNFTKKDLSILQHEQMD